MKTFRQYLIPSIIAQVFMSCYAIIDGIFIGYKMNDLGLAAINLAWPITAFIQGVGFALGISAGIYISRIRGLGEKMKIKRLKTSILLILLIASIVLGFLFFFLKRPILILFQAKNETLDAADKYITIILFGSIFQLLGCALGPIIKNDGYVKSSMCASLLATLVNFILDYFFIVRFEFGLEGAAVASVIGQGVAFLICLIPYVKQMKGIYLDKEFFREIFLGAMAPFILNYSYSIIIILTNALAENYSGDEAVAAYTVLSYMLYVINALAQGTSDAIQPLFSYNSIQKNYKLNRKYLYKCFIISFILVSIFSLAFFLLRDPIARLYGLSQLACDIFNFACIFYIFGFIIISFSKVICSYLYSINKKLLANILVLAEPILLTPIAYFIFVNCMGLLGLWISFLVIQALLGIMAFYFYYVSRREENGWIFGSRQRKIDDQSNGLS